MSENRWPEPGDWSRAQHMIFYCPLIGGEPVMWLFPASDWSTKHESQPFSDGLHTDPLDYLGGS